MYGFLWRLLPGPTPVRVLIAALLIAAVFYGLMEFVFPYVSTLMPYNDVSV